MKNYFIIHGSFGRPFGNWSKLSKYYLDLGLINENTTIIGHSIAPIFVSKFLVENKVKVKKLIFVCGFNNYLGINEEYDNVNKSMYFDNLEYVKQYVYFTNSYNACVIYYDI